VSESSGNLVVSHGGLNHAPADWLPETRCMRNWNNTGAKHDCRRDWATWCCTQI